MFNLKTLVLFALISVTPLNAQMEKAHYRIDTDSLQLKIIVGEKVIYVNFNNNKTTEDFIKQLPLTLIMQDLNGREKYSSLSMALSKESNIKTTFEEGDIAYWLGGGLAVFYHQDKSVIKAGLIVIAKLKNEKEIFSNSDTIEVKFEAVKKI